MECMACDSISMIIGARDLKSFTSGLAVIELAPNAIHDMH